MAAVNQPVEQVTDLVQKISLESQTKANDVADANKKAGGVNGGVNASIPPVDRSVSPLIPDYTDPTMCYVPGGYQSGYYYGGYDGSLSDWDDYSRYLNTDASAVYGDSSSLMYGYGYPPYGPYSPAGSPVPTMGHDGQLYAQQQYQYPSYYQSPTQHSEPYNPKQTPATQSLPTSATTDKPALSVELPNGNSKGSVNGNINGSVPLKMSQQNSSSILNGSYGRGGVYSGGVNSSGYHDPRFNFDGLKSPTPWLDSPSYNDRKHKPATSSALFSPTSHANNIQTGRNQNQRPYSNNLHMSLQSHRTSGIGASPGYFNSMYTNNSMYPNNSMYGPYGSNFRAGSGYGYTGYDSRTNGRGWMSGDSKYRNKGRGFGYGNENMDGLNELNRGPRAKGLKNQKAVASTTVAGKGQDVSSDVGTENKDDSSANSEMDQYNREDFPVKYNDAKFFIIKSYSEDDVHKSIKYSVWASTPNGNKKLAAGYQEAQEKSGGCPVFLLFSVNTSGQFVGLAEMVGPVDFDKTVEYWQQDKWTGCFPVKWHIVKDVPNSLLKHITLENNDNKPVTNSRDTQEVRLEQGLQVLKIFKEHSCKTSILDDFEFYEGREKTVQEKKAKQQQYPKQGWEGKATDAVVSGEKEKVGNTGELKLPNSLENDLEVARGVPVENISILKKGTKPSDSGELKPEGAQQVPANASQANGEPKQPEEAELIGKSDVSKGATPVTVATEKAVANGVTNGF